MDILSLFPKAVSRNNIGRPFSNIELAVLENLETRLNSGNVTSTNVRVLELPELANLKNIILNDVYEYFEKVISPRDSIEPYITISWTNVTETDGFHHKHTHGNSILSGVLYVIADASSDSILFYDEVYKTIELRPKNWNVWNSPSWEIPVATGDLLLFPSSLNHEVRVIKKSNHKRISLAFNVFIKGTVGSHLDLNWADIK